MERRREDERPKPVAGLIRKLLGGLALVIAFAALLPADGAAAHVRASDGTSVIRQQGSTVHYRLSLEYEVLLASIGRGGSAPAGDRAGQERRLVAERDQLAGYLSERVVVSLDGVACEGRLNRTGVESREQQTYATADLAYRCPGSPGGTYRVQYDVFSEAEAVVDDHTNIADYQLGTAAGTFVFDAAHRELDVGRTGAAQAASRFVALGTKHILGGLDHVLFIVVLLVGARDLRTVVKLASSFTLAHTLTLGLGALGWVHVPAQIVEPLIALSIAYVAVENIIGGAARHRVLVVFGFGLLHGLGFAGSLSLTDQLSGRLLGALLSFNVGIELGQALIIAALFPALSLVRRYAWSATVHTGAAALIGIVGVVWFFQRLVL